MSEIQTTEPRVRPPGFGEYAPYFTCLSDRNPRFRFASLGGRWMILMFFGSLLAPGVAAAMAAIKARRAVFDDQEAQFFGVSVDEKDRSERGLKNSPPGVRYFWDFDAAVSRAYGVAQQGTYMPCAFLLDRTLRVAAVAPVAHVNGLIDRLEVELRAERAVAESAFAPVLTIPRVFEPEFCQRLISYYEETGGEASGFMMEENGLTVGRLDDGQKRRRDVTIADQQLREAAGERITRRLVPAIERSLGFRTTRIERYIVACYSSADRGFFFAHRDNLSPGTAHRKFAVTLNLNAEAYEGGELRFPEFGMRTYKPPTGGATVFACGLLHEATPVTSGVRYAFLPFLYDEEGRRIREANKHTIVPVQTSPALGSDSDSWATGEVEVS